MNDVMANNSALWTVCLSHTLGCCIRGTQTKSTIFGVDKKEFDGPNNFVKEARKARKLPKSATKGIKSK